MGFFKTKQDISLEEFCTNFYSKNIISGITGGIDVNTHYYKGFQDFIGEVFPDFLTIDFDKLKKEFTALRFELFSLAWQYSFNEECTMRQNIFTLNYLRDENKYDIWEDMQSYNSAISSAITNYACDNEIEKLKLQESRMNLFEKHIGVHTEENFNAIARASNRINAQKILKSNKILYNLSFALLRKLNYSDDIILNNNLAISRLMIIVAGFYKGSKESFEKYNITYTRYIDDYELKREALAKAYSTDNQINGMYSKLGLPLNFNNNLEEYNPLEIINMIKIADDIIYNVIKEGLNTEDQNVKKQIQKIFYNKIR